MLLVMLYLLPAIYIASLALKQISYVLVYGSVFNGVRDVLQAGIRNKVPFTRLLHELFTCTLCMTTNLSIWLVCIPVAVAIFYYGPALPLFPSEQLAQIGYALGGGFVVAMAVAALATRWMSHVEYPARRYNTLLENYRVAQERIRQLETAPSATPAPITPAVFSFEQFETLLNEIDEGCAGISCVFMLANCQSMHMISGLERLIQSGMSVQTAALLATLLRPLVREYFRNSLSRHKERVTQQEYRRTIYERLLMRVA